MEGVQYSGGISSVQWKDTLEEESFMVHHTPGVLPLFGWVRTEWVPLTRVGFFDFWYHAMVVDAPPQRSPTTYKKWKLGFKCRRNLPRTEMHRNRVKFTNEMTVSLSRAHEYRALIGYPKYSKQLNIRRLYLKPGIWNRKSGTQNLELKVRNHEYVDKCRNGRADGYNTINELKISFEFHTVQIRLLIFYNTLLFNKQLDPVLKVAIKNI